MNPELQAARDQIAELEARIRDLESTQTRALPYQKLGFRDRVAWESYHRKYVALPNGARDLENMWPFHLLPEQVVGRELLIANNHRGLLWLPSPFNPPPWFLCPCCFLPRPASDAPSPEAHVNGCKQCGYERTARYKYWAGGPEPSWDQYYISRGLEPEQY